MREYAEEGIRHFYFMMLQKDEVKSTDVSSTYISILLLNSSSMQRNEVESVDLLTIAVIRTATSQSGQLDITFGWVFMQKEISKGTKS